MNPTPLLWPTASSLWTLGAGIAVVATPASPLRAFLLLSFLLVLPGLALVRFLRIGDFVMELTLALALGIVLSTLVSGTMAYAGQWVPMLGLAVLMCITLAANAVEALRVRAAHRPELGTKALSVPPEPASNVSDPIDEQIASLLENVSSKH
ncbi:MAG: hypothetical protein M3550_08655 [Actinomycetota bacterium]|nr:hypothetical protein [Actinomycetota bacterium]